MKGKRGICLLLLISLTMLGCGDAGQREKTGPAEPIAAPEEQNDHEVDTRDNERPEIAHEDRDDGKMPISGSAAENDPVYSAYIESIRDRETELFSGKMTIDGISMYISTEIIGQPDENGYPLYIGLRGGGNPDTSLAKEQYESMKTYYSYNMENGIYVVPCGFQASWDEHYRPESFLFYDRIIEDAIAFLGADPNRVYLTGFSSGGDGVYMVAPHMADRFAAANMSAGFPHELRVGNLHNLPFCIQVGEKDDAYSRNERAVFFDGLLNDAAAEYGGGFLHETFIHYSGTHNQNWSDVREYVQNVYTGDQLAVWLKDPSKAGLKKMSTVATDWLMRFKRDPYPQKIVWDTDVSASLRRSQAFYWLDRDAGLAHASLVVSYDKALNSVTVEESDATKGKLKIYLNPDMLDVYSDVTVNVLGQNYTVRPYVSEQIKDHTLRARGDRNYMFTSEIDIVFGADGRAKEVYAAETAKDEYEAPADQEWISWSDTGLFYVDNSLFGLTYAEMQTKLGTDLPELEPWTWWGYDLSWTYADYPNGETVVYMFQNGRCVIIYSEKEGQIPEKLMDDDKAHLGEFVNGLCCRHTIENNYYDDLDHIKQIYYWYRYEEYEDMFDLITIR